MDFGDADVFVFLFQIAILAIAQIYAILIINLHMRSRETDTYRGRMFASNMDSCVYTVVCLIDDLPTNDIFLCFNMTEPSLIFSLKAQHLHYKNHCCGTYRNCQ